MRVRGSPELTYRSAGLATEVPSRVKSFPKLCRKLSRELGRFFVPPTCSFGAGKSFTPAEGRFDKVDDEARDYGSLTG